ncbi:EcKinase, DUF1679, and/or APH domain containing protein [Asbolus verrucosus]|uniref:EcKinase, DUF1679, and/or APH domain containing protein n=1 Tax=Asbolus verrucosus TaxID=1661398 RepID=A0A482WAP4_ASBVE|nr:EcKinase, DUF1679, and/or APH domain containing protein [Asbolus verrucosus]
MEALKVRPQMATLIKNVSQEEGINNYIITDVKTNQKGEGYLGEIFMVTVKDTDSDKHLDVIIKAAFIDEKVREMAPIRMSFQNEINFYVNVYPRFEKFEKERGVSQTVQLVPKCLMVYEEEKEEMLALENIKVLEMSKLAANSLIPGEDDEVIKKFEKYAGRNIVNIFKNISVEKCDYSAILHGDCWSNNMLFRYEDEGHDKKPTDIRLIDWQIIKVGSPVCDLSYCLYSGASKKVFDNLNEYLKIYYDSFSSFVRELGSDPEKLFPFDALKEHWKKYSRFGMIMALTILRMKLTNKEDLIDFRDDFEMDEIVSIVAKSRFCEEDYNKRIRGLLWHMSELDAL